MLHTRLSPTFQTFQSNAIAEIAVDNPTHLSGNGVVQAAAGPALKKIPTGSWNVTTGTALQDVLTAPTVSFSARTVAQTSAARVGAALLGLYNAGKAVADGLIYISALGVCSQ